MQTIEGTKFYDTFDLVKKLPLSRLTILKYLKEGRIKAKKIGSTWQVTEAHFQEYLKGSENDK
jgi:excisionase family DNA binding protein